MVRNTPANERNDTRQTTLDEITADDEGTEVVVEYDSPHSDERQTFTGTITRVGAAHAWIDTGEEYDDGRPKVRCVTHMDRVRYDDVGGRRQTLGDDATIYVIDETDGEAMADGGQPQGAEIDSGDVHTLDVGDVITLDSWRDSRDGREVVVTRTEPFEEPDDPSSPRPPKITAGSVGYMPVDTSAEVKPGNVRGVVRAPAIKRRVGTGYFEESDDEPVIMTDGGQDVDDEDDDEIIVAGDDAEILTDGGLELSATNLRRGDVLAFPDDSLFEIDEVRSRTVTADEIHAVEIGGDRAKTWRTYDVSRALDAGTEVIPKETRTDGSAQPAMADGGRRSATPAVSPGDVAEGSPWSDNPQGQTDEDGEDDDVVARGVDAVAEVLHFTFDVAVAGKWVGTSGRTNGHVRPPATEPPAPNWVPARTPPTASDMTPDGQGGDGSDGVPDELAELRLRTDGGTERKSASDRRHDTMSPGELVEDTPVRRLDGVGPRKAESLCERGFETVGDVAECHAAKLLDDGVIGDVTAARIWNEARGALEGYDA